MSLAIKSRSLHSFFGLATLLIAGCGNQYRPVVTATNPVGPAAQPAKYAVTISNPGSGQPGLLTFVDVSGDTIITSPSIQVNPNYIALNNSGNTGYTINQTGALDTFGTGNPSGLITSEIPQTTLAASVAPTSLSAIALRGAAQGLFIPETANGKVAVLNSSGQLLQEVSVAPNPVYIVGSDATQRVYAVSNGTTPGSLAAIESSTGVGYSISATIPVGTNPVYGVMTADTQRAFILDKGSQDIAVVNVSTNALDTGVNHTANPSVTTTGFIPIPTTLVGGFNIASNPLWADLSTATNQLIVLSAGDGTHRGSLSIINIPLCSAAAQPTNPNCNTTNPVDSTLFGTFAAAPIPVGINPTMVSVLKDGSRAYVVNQLDGTGLCAAGQGSVSVVNLTTTTVTATLCGGPDSTNAATPLVFGHPTTIAATTGTPTGKVYVTSPDSHQLTIIYTDTDTVFTHVPLYGAGVKVVVNQP